MRCLIVTAVDAEAGAIHDDPDTCMVVSGIGRTNAAASTTQAILENEPFDFVISAGVAGALPDGGLAIGDLVVATRCVYAEEGMITPEGFQEMSEMGFDLGDFSGNAVPVSDEMLDRLESVFRAGPIATVATCSGSDKAAHEVRERTGAIAEAMEGAAVVHAARRLGVKAIELRAVSNTTGDRSRQEWDLPAALLGLGNGMREALSRLRG